MTESQAVSPTVSGGWVARFTAFLFGGVVYITFLFTILYAVGFVSGLVVPKSIDTGADPGIFAAIVVNLALMALLAVQHRAMKRWPFRHWWTQFIPGSVERSMGVFCTSLTLLLLFWQWRPMPDVIWHVQEPEIAMIIATISFIGWVSVVTRTLLSDRFGSFGHQQFVDPIAGRECRQSVSKISLVHRLVRHPIYVGLIIALWAAPTMSAGHLLFAGVTTAYIFMGVLLEDCDVSGTLGDEYRHPGNGFRYCSRCMAD